jgi:hypothetical protein
MKKSKIKSRKKSRIKSRKKSRIKSRNKIRNKFIINPEIVNKNKSGNNLLILLESFPDASWDYNELSSNPNINWNYIQKNINKKWNWKKLSSNPAITWDIIKSQPYVKWHWDFITRNPNINLEIIKSNPDKKWDWEWLSKQPYITWDIIKEMNKEHMYFDFYSNFSDNPNITINIVADENQKSEFSVPWDYYKLSCNQSITWIDIKNNPDLPWNWDSVSENPNITWDIVKSNQEISSVSDSSVSPPSSVLSPTMTNLYTWDYKGLTRNPSITLDDIINNPLLSENCDWDYLSSSPKITKNFLEYFIDKKWNWCELSMNRVINFQIVKSLKTKKWCMKCLSLNPNITWKIVKDNPNLNWDWKRLSANLTNSKKWSVKGLSINPNLTSEIVLSNKKLSWDWNLISKNNFKKGDNIQFIKNYFNHKSKNKKDWTYLIHASNPSAMKNISHSGGLKCSNNLIEEWIISNYVKKKFGDYFRQGDYRYRIIELLAKNAKNLDSLKNKKLKHKISESIYDEPDTIFAGDSYTPGVYTNLISSKLNLDNTRNLWNFGGIRPSLLFVIDKKILSDKAWIYCPSMNYGSCIFEDIKNNKKVDNKFFLSGKGKLNRKNLNPVIKDINHQLNSSYLYSSHEIIFDSIPLKYIKAIYVNNIFDYLKQAEKYFAKRNRFRAKYFRNIPIKRLPKDTTDIEGIFESI